jgi:nitrogen regulatory protein PII
MKRIEMVIAPWTLDTFKETAPQLGISEFALVEVYRLGCETTDGRKRIYRGCEFKADFSPRLRIEFAMFDDDVQATVHQLLELVHPESISVFRLDQEVRTISSEASRLNALDPSHPTSTSETAVSAQIMSLASRRDGKHRNPVNLPPIRS